MVYPRPGRACRSNRSASTRCGIDAYRLGQTTARDRVQDAGPWMASPAVYARGPDNTITCASCRRGAYARGQARAAEPVKRSNEAQSDGRRRRPPPTSKAQGTPAIERAQLPLPPRRDRPRRHRWRDARVRRSAASDAQRRVRGRRGEHHGAKRDNSSPPRGITWPARRAPPRRFDALLIRKAGQAPPRVDTRRLLAFEAATSRRIAPSPRAPI